MFALFQPYMPTIVGFLLSSIFAINVWFFRWLIGSFREFRADIKLAGELVMKIQESFMKAMNDHEALDQRRHEENLYRFEKVAVALARLGSPNGTYQKD